jgi:large subunit ribosomal protein L25
MERVKLGVRVREGRGGKDAKAVRSRGEIPGVMYAAGKDTVAIAINARELRQAVSSVGGAHTILDVTLDGTKRARTAIIKDMQLDPVRDRVLHIDLHEIRLDQKITAPVAVHLEGHAEGVSMGGALSQPTHEVNVEGLPTDIPEHVTVDVSALEIGGSIRLSDIQAPRGITFVDDPESTVLATIAAPVSEEELMTEAELEAAAEAEEAEAAAAEAAEAAAEGAEGAEPAAEGGEPQGE